MKVYVRPRAGGKTRELIELAAQERLVIVCVNMENVRLVADRARDMNLNIPQPISFQQLARGIHRGRRINGLAFDNAELCLQELAGPIPIAAMTVTGSVQEPAALAGR